MKHSQERRACQENSSMELTSKGLEVLGLLRKKNAPRSWRTFLQHTIGNIFVWHTVYHAVMTNGVYICFMSSSADDFAEDLAERLAFLLINCWFLTRVLTFILQSEKIYELVETLRRIHELETCDDETVRTELNKSQTVMKMVKKAYLFTAFAVLPYATTSVTLQYMRRRNVFRGWYPMDINTSPGLEITLVIQAVAILSLCSVTSQVDSFIVCALYDIMNQFKLIGHKIEKVREQAVKNVTDRLKQDKMAAMHKVMRRWRGKSLPSNRAPQGYTEVNVQGDGGWDRLVDDEMCKLLAGMVDQHMMLIKFAKDFEKIFNPIMISQVISNLFLTSLCIFLMTKKGMLSLFSVPMIELSSLLIVELYLYCYLVDSISEQSARIRDRAYSCAWLRSSTRFNKSLRLVMSMANRELRLRVNRHVPLSMETFAQITKFSWSLLTLVMSISDPARRR